MGRFGNLSCRRINDCRTGSKGCSILVPYPFAVDDHQTSNAHFLSDQGAAILMQQTELNPQSMANLLQE